MQIKQIAFWAVFFEVAAYMIVARMALSGVKKFEQDGYESNVRELGVRVGFLRYRGQSAISDLVHQPIKAHALRN